MSWMDATAKREATRDKLKAGDVIGEGVAIAVMTAFLLFLVANQTEQTGFFTSAFGPVEMLAFYGSILYGYLPPILRILLRRRNKVRPFEVIGSGILIIATSYLLAIFPFEFAHLPALLPQWLHFIIDWVTNDVARVLLVLAIVVSALVSVWTFFVFNIVKDWQMRNGT